MQHKTETATAIAYAAATGSVAVGHWTADNWDKIIGVIFLVLTFVTHLYFLTSRNQRQTRSEMREKKRHAKEMELHELEIERLKKLEGEVEEMRGTLEQSETKDL